jgi:hypothetical protein
MALDPAKLDYIQYPEFWVVNRGWASGKTRFIEGRWDHEIPERLYWSSVYEPKAGSESGMIPLRRYSFYTSLEDRFLRGISWENTEWYQWLLSRKVERSIRRYHDVKEIHKRLTLLEGLYERFKAGECVDSPNDRPRVNLGRSGKISIDDGRHRLCLAKVAKLGEIIVKVTVVHPGATWEPGTLAPSSQIARPLHPEGARSRFYLAQSYRDAGEYDLAHQNYDRRVAMGGWIEEVYVAQCEKAKLAIRLQHPHQDIVAEHLKAWHIRPSRAEALWQLASYCRKNKRYAEGYLFAKVGKDVPLSTDTLFVQREVYEWRLLDELAICAYWIGQYEESAWAGKRLLEQGRYPPTEQARLETNLSFALAKLS